MSHPNLVSFSSESAELWAHVLSCPRCRRQALRLLLRGLPGRATSSRDLDYSAMWDRLASTRAAAVVELTREETQFPFLLEELLALDPAERLKQVLKDPRYASYPLAQSLIETAHTASWEEQAEGLSRLALQVARRVAAGGAGAEVVRDLEATALTTVADSLRRQGNLAGAEAELLRAQGKLEAPPSQVDPRSRAFLCQALGLLRRDQGRIDESLALLGHAAELWSAAGVPYAERSAWTVLGEVSLVEAGDGERALAAFDMAATVPGSSPPEDLEILCGTARALSGLGRRREGLDLLRQCRRERLEEGSKEALILLSLEGRLDGALGRVAEARRILLKTFSGLKGFESWYEAVQAGVALASLLEPGSKRQRRLLIELRDLSRQGNLPQGAQEALGALAVGGHSSCDLDRLYEYLERARSRPHLKWLVEERDASQQSIH